MTNFDDLDDRLRLLALEIEKIDIFPYVGREAVGLFKYRIFNESRATDGSSLPRYKSEYYKKKKKKTSSVWDLRVEGDLDNSIIERLTKDGVQVVMLNVASEGGQTQPQKAKGLEDRAGKEIFAFSEREIQEIRDLANKEYLKQVNKAFRRVFK